MGKKAGRGKKFLKHEPFPGGEGGGMVFSLLVQNTYFMRCFTGLFIMSVLEIWKFHQEASGYVCVGRVKSLHINIPYSMFSVGKSYPIQLEHILHVEIFRFENNAMLSLCF